MQERLQWRSLIHPSSFSNWKKQKTVLQSSVVSSVDTIIKHSQELPLEAIKSSLDHTSKIAIEPTAINFIIPLPLPNEKFPATLSGVFCWSPTHNMRPRVVLSTQLAKNQQQDTTTLLDVNNSKKAAMHLILLLHYLVFQIENCLATLSIEFC